MVDVNDVEGDGGEVGIERAVAGLEGEAVGADVAGRGGVGAVGTGEGAAERAVEGKRHHGVGERIVFHIGGRESEGIGGVLRDGQRLAGRDGGVVHGCHGDRDGGGGGGEEGGVGGLEREAVGAAVIQRGRVDEGVGGSGFQVQRSVGRRRVDGEREGVAIHIGARELDVHRDFLGGRDRRECGGDGGVVDRADGDRDGRGQGVERTVAKLKGKAVGAVVVERGLIGVGVES